MNVLKLCAIAPVVLTLVSCGNADSFLGEGRDKGTNIGFMKCVEDNKGAGLASQVVRAQCLERHAKEFVSADIDGYAYYSSFEDPRYRGLEASEKKKDKKSKKKDDFLSFLDDFYNCEFAGKITNKEKDKIITGFNITIAHKDNKDNSGNQILEEHMFNDVYIQPGNDYEFTICNVKINKYDSECKMNLKYTPDEEKLSSDNYTWSISKVSGLNVKIK